MAKNDAAVSTQDVQIIDGLWARDERAAEMLWNCYGSLIRRTVRRYLDDAEDQEECCNDVLLTLWHHIPPDRPRSLAAYITLRASSAAIDRFRRNISRKNLATRFACSLDELAEVLPGGEDPEDAVFAGILKDCLTDFVRALPDKKRYLFVSYYYFGDTAEELAADLGMTPAAVRKQLQRTAAALKAELLRKGAEHA